VSSATRVHARPFRPRIERSDILASASWFTKRDDSICMDLYNHRVLTTNQLSDLHFTDPRRARDRLLKLYRHRVIDRFRPFRQLGSAPWHYVLDELGARVAAATLGIELKQLRYRLERDLDLVNSPRLQHLVEVNDFFVSLITRCRAKPGFELDQWWSEQRCAAKLPTKVRSDGLGRLMGGERPCTFVLELDRGTERGDRLRRKLLSYGRLGRRRDAPDAIVFLFPSAKRERSARQKLDIDIRLRVATSHRGLYDRDPLARVWLPIKGDRRISFAELPAAKSEMGS
jgi:hypothetical protein